MSWESMGMEKAEFPWFTRCYIMSRELFLSWEAEQSREEATSQLEMSNMWKVQGVEVLG